MAWLSALRARDFRCFGQLACELSPGATLFIGDNAQGKTSILEAVCVLLRLQSPRTHSLAELPRLGQADFGLSGDLPAEAVTLGTGNPELTRLTMHWRDGRRQLAAGGDEELTPSRYLARSAVLVWMGNEDVALVRGTGDGRRRYLDFLGTQAFPGYRTALLAYDKALRSRNRLLKDDRPDRRQIDAYTGPLVESGTTLTGLRRDLVTRLNPWAAMAHRDICARDESLALTYRSGATDDFAVALATSADEECRRRLTVVGPHRDELALDLDTRPAAVYASEGQQRTVALALKLAQARLLQSLHATPPILLIDDIFGELDPHRRNALLRALPANAQHLITTTHPGWMADSLSPQRTYRVDSGTVTRET